MNTKRLAYLISLFFLAPIMCMAQGTSASTMPTAELAGGYSFVNVHPNLAPVTSFNINGGGIAFVYNVTHLIGVRADFFGYTGGGSKIAKQLGVAGNVSGNLVTYMFGPQIKKHTGRFQPYGEALFGAGHSSTVAKILNIEQGITTGGASNNAFAFQFGGGLDIKVSPRFSIRPVEVDYLGTRFGGQHYKATQNNFKYFLGFNLGFGGK
jgi:opacity protein-like surface antigen